MTTSATFVDLRINNAEQFKESVSEPTQNTKIYLTFGKVDAWANDASPNVANSSVATVYEIWSNMIGGKKILGNDVQHMIPRFNWTANNVYTAYDHMNSNLYDGNTQFYVINSDYSVYKCIANANSLNSTVEPTSVNPAITSATSDGYLWKYMYTLNDYEKTRFLTDSYIPVKTLTVNDGSVQWTVQQNAEKGSIEHIEVTNSGSNYTNISNVTITITGDGSSATAIPVLNTSTNVISSITITNPGTLYTYANVAITDAGLGTGAKARPIISPIGGHGSDPLYELGGKNIMISVRILYDENGTLPVTNDLRQITLLKDPLIRSSANVISNTVFLQAKTLTVAGTGDYIQDEIVYQGSSLATATFKGRVVSWVSSTNKLILINTEGTVIASQSVTGSTSFTVRTLSGIVEEALEKYTGKILYADNIKPVTRSSDQIEEYKILVEF
jgi:hypothetical protein